MSYTGECKVRAVDDYLRRGAGRMDDAHPRENGVDWMLVICARKIEYILAL